MLSNDKLGHIWYKQEGDDWIVYTEARGYHCHCECEQHAKERVLVLYQVETYYENN